MERLLKKTLDKGENVGSLEQEVGEKSDNASTIAENSPTLKISGTWTIRTNTKMD